ncbi:4-coumarate--CoA ligase-like 7 [Platanthera zijinensis]|uniref:4-coumarate--CoA ligase n=1 Tax=Platanthera zijinensis TaxID=2320716 RepID=A0AAP0BC30_9ASPA
MAFSCELYSPDGVYRSPRPPLAFPSEPSLSMITFLFHKAALHPNRLAIADVDSNETLTFSQLRSAVHSAAAGFRRLGIGKGSVVLLFAPNAIHFAVSFFAIVAAGAVVTTVNPVYTAAELSKQARDSGAKLVVTVSHLWHKVKSLRLPTIFLGSADISATALAVRFFSELLSVPETEYVPADVRQSDVAALLYSSGTTGASKGVMLTHRNFICTSLMVSGDQELLGEPANSFLCFLPLFHVYGMSVLAYSQLQRGNSVVLMGRFEMETALRSIEKYRVTHLCVVPPVMIALAKHKNLGSYDLSSLTLINSGAAPLGKDVMNQVAKNFPKAWVFQGYGLTESTGAITLGYPQEKDQKYGSAGFLLAGVEGRVIGLETQEPLPPSQVGELCFRGPNIMKGYFNNPEATKLTLDGEGWLHTGDVGYFDEKGQLFVIDRIKELIKYKGFQVAPAELEAVLLSHPDILDAAVIPFPDEEAGEVPIAYVVHSSSCSLTEAEVQKFVANQVAPFKRLRRVTFVNSVPKSASGKILRRELIEKVRKNKNKKKGGKKTPLARCRRPAKKAAALFKMKEPQPYALFHRRSRRRRWIAGAAEGRKPAPTAAVDLPSPTPEMEPMPLPCTRSELRSIFRRLQRREKNSPSTLPPSGQGSRCPLQDEGTAALCSLSPPESPPPLDRRSRRRKKTRTRRCRGSPLSYTGDGADAAAVH